MVPGPAVPLKASLPLLRVGAVDGPSQRGSAIGAAHMHPLERASSGFGKHWGE